ncbi:hypothetical protein BJ508DRAFT_378870 [Ascobolus immersus RN42]|uniref:Uncharacterized protein n=1 Tax=Ascobolus immersus RN42 TaxID=1160509 RepID=A0A3N4HWH7_ASCIM|nr:hypothetical protein BJ508DRAFT_378870 [Ascobolus immersus RN42]
MKTQTRASGDGNQLLRGKVLCGATFKQILHNNASDFRIPMNRDTDSELQESPTSINLQLQNQYLEGFRPEPANPPAYRHRYVAPAYSEKALLPQGAFLTCRCCLEEFRNRDTKQATSFYPCLHEDKLADGTKCLGIVMLGDMDMSSDTEDSEISDDEESENGSFMHCGREFEGSESICDDDEEFESVSGSYMLTSIRTAPVNPTEYNTIHHSRATIDMEGVHSGTADETISSTVLDKGKSKLDSSETHMARYFSEWVEDKSLQLHPERLPPQLIAALLDFREEYGEHHLKELAEYSRIDILYGSEDPNTNVANLEAGPFEQIYVEQFIFYIEHLHQYLNEFRDGVNIAGLSKVNPNLHLTQEHAKDIVAHAYHGAVQAITSHDNFLHMRWQKGLLRVELVRLIGIAFRRMRDELQKLIGLSCGLEELFLTIYERFRSERLELLVMRYVDEDDVNDEVAEGVLTSMTIAARVLQAREKGESNVRGEYQGDAIRRLYEGVVKAYKFYGADRRTWPVLDDWRECVICQKLAGA